MFVGDAEETPDACHVRESITWLTNSPAHMNSSHQSTEVFYNGLTRCDRVIYGAENRTGSLEELLYNSITELLRRY